MTPEELLKGYLAGMGGLPFAIVEGLKQNLKPKGLDLTQFYQTPEAEKPVEAGPEAAAPVPQPVPQALPPGSAPLRLRS